MKNWKKYFLVMLNLVVFSPFLLAGERQAEIPPAATVFSLSTQASFPLHKTLPCHLSANLVIDFAVHYTTEQEVACIKNFVKYKKKYKRAYSSSTRLKPPVKEIEPLAVNIFTKESYSKPFFLSHLHHFLFRLTPF